MAEDNRAQEAPEGSIQVQPQFVITALQQEIDQAISDRIMKGALIQQLLAQVAELQQELQQTRIERDALVEARPSEVETMDVHVKVPAKS